MGVETSDKYKLYILLPVRIKDEFEIRELHPNIIEVHLPRQKSRRWCIIVFENKEKLQEALADLKKVRINNKSIKIRPYKRGDKNSKVVKSKGKAKGSAKQLLELLKNIT
ncbi:hypothetical protein NQ314_018481 [Rhamnusium bicolor]|uniref:RRM domain-containing protein n=1 Tax=Rhamnusium bicolor TaxID=1586634 RepID=A0AAV8WS06_9CUCU|nr:hypothetical protein NQ314_018481 [Rhamnusium bicolor]